MRSQAASRTLGMTMATRTRPVRVVMLILLSGVLPAGRAVAQTVDRSKAVDGFGEARRGDVPEGTVELMTSETDKTIKTGLA